MFGDSPFFGGSVFQTPSAPAWSAPPAPNYGGCYSYGPNHSGFVNSGFSGPTFTGYKAEPYGTLHYYDCNRPFGG